MRKSLLLYTAALLAAMTATASAQVPVPRLHMPVGAAEIESHDASPGFIKQIAGCYKRVPNALLARVENPRIVAERDIAAMITRLNLPADYFTKRFGERGTNLKVLRGFANVWDNPRAIVLFENTLGADHPNYICHVLIHELAHLYDYPVKFGSVPAQSANENFSNAFRQDLADINKKRSTTNEMREAIERHKHYTLHPGEAFAEATARIIFLHPNMEPYKIYAALFPNVMSYVRQLLIDDGIIRPDHK
jgi:hypothetical protein